MCKWVIQMIFHSIAILLSVSTPPSPPLLLSDWTIQQRTDQLRLHATPPKAHFIVKTFLFCEVICWVIWSVCNQNTFTLMLCFGSNSSIWVQVSCVTLALCIRNFLSHWMLCSIECTVMSHQSLPMLLDRTGYWGSVLIFCELELSIQLSKSLATPLVTCLRLPCLVQRLFSSL